MGSDLCPLRFFNLVLDTPVPEMGVFVAVLDGRLWRPTFTECFLAVDALAVAAAMAFALASASLSALWSTAIL